MKVFLDEQLTGMEPYLRFASFEVVTVNDEGLAGYSDEKVVAHAKEKDYVFVTENQDAEKLAKESGIKYIYLDMVFKAKAVQRELETRFKD